MMASGVIAVLRRLALSGILPAATLALLAACAGPPSSMDPDDDPTGLMATEPSIRGIITSTEAGSVLVEENPDDESGSAKAHVRVGPGTEIRLAEDTPGTPADLKTGLTVSVWFVGPVAESYPVQASGGAIRIEGGPAGVGP